MEMEIEKMNIKKIVMTCIFATAAMMSLNALAYSGSEYEKEAKLTIAQAREIALKTYPGTVVDEELEHKLGGSGLRFTFDIRANHITHEVAVDAKTGTVLANVKDTDD